MKYAWLTDVHLNFLDHNKRNKWYQQLKKYKGVIISGDIGEATNVFGILKEMYKVTQKPIYYVLGNHDYYRGDIEEVRKYAQCVTEDYDTYNNNVIYLTTAPMLIPLKKGVFLCGVDGWADAQAGDFDKSDIELNDSIVIADLRYARHFGGRPGLKQKMYELSVQDASLLDGQLDSIRLHCHEENIKLKEVVIVTHIPPFEEASRYKGKQTGKDFLPFFCNPTLGVTILEFARNNPEVKVTVLCGHTHDKVDYEKLPNLKVRVGGATYYLPDISGEI